MHGLHCLHCSLENKVVWPRALHELAERRHDRLIALRRFRLLGRRRVARRRRGACQSGHLAAGHTENLLNERGHNVVRLRDLGTRLAAEVA